MISQKFTWLFQSLNPETGLNKMNLQMQEGIQFTMMVNGGNLVNKPIFCQSICLKEKKSKTGNFYGRPNTCYIVGIEIGWKGKIANVLR